MGGQKASQVIMRRGAVRLQANGCQVLGKSISKEFLLGIDGSQVVMCVRRVRIQIDRLLELVDRFVQPATIGQLDAPRVVLVRKRDVVLFAWHRRLPTLSPKKSARDAPGGRLRRRPAGVPYARGH